MAAFLPSGLPCTEKHDTDGLLESLLVSMDSASDASAGGLVSEGCAEGGED